MNDQQQIENDRADALSGDILFPSYSKAHLLKLTCGALLALLPVLLYVCIVAFCFYNALSLAIRLFPGFGNSSHSFYVTVYVIALLVIALVLTCLLRPFIACRKKVFCLKLPIDEQGDIYAFVNRVAELVGIDPVKEIYINSEVVVDGGYEGVIDFYKKRFGLKIGLPLIPILSANEFCSLLVHEFAHYTNPKVKNAYFTIRNVRAWLYRIANDEDGWYSRLDAFAEKSGLLRSLLMPAFLSIALVNKTFQLFLNVIELLTNSSVQEAEFQADLLQANILGSRQFDHLLKLLVQIDQAYQLTLERCLSGEEVSENIADAILLAYKKSALQSDQFIEMAPSERFNSWHLLPPPNIRTRRIQKSDIASVYSVDGSLDGLFANVYGLGVALSSEFYLEHDVTAERKRSSKPIDKRKSVISMSKEEAVLKRFTSGLYRRDIAWEFSRVDKFSALSSEKITPFLNKLVVSIRHSLPELVKYMERLDDYEKQLSRLHFAQWLVKDGSRNRPGAEELDELKFNKKDFERKFSGKKELYRKSYGVRVAAAVAMGRESKAYGSAGKLITLLTRLGEQQDSLSESKIKCATLEKLIVRRAEGDAFHQNTVSRLTRMILKVVESLEIVLVRIPESLIPADTDIQAGRLELDSLNGEDYEKLVVDRFLELVRYYEAFNTAISAKLAQFVEMVERKQNIESVLVVAVKTNG